MIMMILLDVSIQKSWISKAEEKAKRVGKLNKSILEGKGNFNGFLGEQIISNYYGLPFADTRDFDLTWKGRRIEIKTKGVAFVPTEDYEVSIQTYYKQSTDYYVFVRVHYDRKRAWILGYIKPEEYFKKAILMKKGYTDPTNGFQFKADTWNLRIHQLYDLEKMFNEIEELTIDI